MKLSIFTITGVVLLLSSCAQFATDRNTDLAIDTYAPSVEALGAAENRAKEYWAKHHEQIGRDTRYLAVQSDSIFSNEIPDLYAKLINSPADNPKLPLSSRHSEQNGLSHFSAIPFCSLGATDNNSIGSLWRWAFLFI